MTADLDVVYDRLVAEEKLKSGTKYERLTAIVFKILDSSAIVIHDVTLRGPGKGSVHQIDVDVTLGATSQRILIECRDRKDAVSLPQARDFKGVLIQLNPDVAFMVSSQGFTAPAEKYAAEEGIHLAVLRGFDEKDWEGRLRYINFEVRARSRGEPKITGWVWKDDDERTRAGRLLTGVVVDRRPNTDQAFFYDESGSHEASFREILEPIFNHLQLNLGPNEGTHSFERIRYIDVEGVRAAVKGFTYSVEGQESVEHFTVGPGARVAELIFRTLDGTIDQIMFDEDFRGWTFAPDGMVVLKK